MPTSRKNWYLQCKLLSGTGGTFRRRAKNRQGETGLQIFYRKIGTLRSEHFDPTGKQQFYSLGRPRPDGRKLSTFPPRQIDFVFGSENLAAVSRAMAINSEATDSDHRPIVCKIPYPLTAEARALKKATGTDLRKAREKTKPLNWFLSDPMYNHRICEELGLDIEDKLDGGLSGSDQIGAYHTYTDGSYLRGHGAGWAFSVFGRGDARGEGKPFLSAAGPIVTLRKSKFFVGAERLTSGVAEINAVIESLLWWASVGEAKKTNRQHQHPIEIGEVIIFTLDSQYVVKLLQGKCRAIENRLLVDFMVHLWKFVGSTFSLRVRWSPGHDNPAKDFIQLPGTDVVDKLARIVGAGSNKLEWWTRPFSLNNWGESTFVAKLQGWASAKRSRVATVTVGCNEQIEAVPQESLQKRNRRASQLPALHPPCRLSSEGSVLTSLGNITRIIAKMLRKLGKISRYFPDKFLLQTPFEYNYGQIFHWQNILLMIW